MILINNMPSESPDISEDEELNSGKELGLSVALLDEEELEAEGQKDQAAEADQHELDLAEADRISDSLHHEEVSEFLDSFENNIDPKAIDSVETRPDGVKVLHCSSMYEYLRFGYRESPKEIAKIEDKNNKAIFMAISSPETIEKGMELLQKTIAKATEEERGWIMGKIGAEGSAVPIQLKDGRKIEIVIMNDMPTRRMRNFDGSMRNEQQLREYDEAYARTVEHEVRHAQFYDKYSRKMEEDWEVKKESASPEEKREYHYNRFTKDEIIAHLQNAVNKYTLEINWDEIVMNLLKKDYMFADTFTNLAESNEYESVMMRLVNIAKATYKETQSTEEVEKALMETDVKEIMSQAR